ncbi:MAG: endonuclease/exonuclease/phosphatase family protein [Thiohalorhabdus sp.]|uniref:endonuclease/exonuclease/phosphatase family protein n=1 Tax=Thiohalorhabdus sp. TaxID=3094134 RepID=UPI002FC3CEF6
MALQEVDASPLGRGTFQMDYLAEATGYTAIPGTTIYAGSGGDCDFGNVLLSAYPVTAVRHIDLSIDGYEPRGAIDADVRVAGGLLRVVATHLGLRHRERAAQVRRLLGALEEAYPRPLVLLGDINEWWPWSRSLRRLRERFGPSPAPPAFPAASPVLALDRIWARPRGVLRKIWAVRSPATRPASDHLPVMGCLDLPGG